MARFRLTSVGKSSGLQLASPAHLPTKVSLVANGSYRLIFCFVKSCGLTALIVLISRGIIFTNLEDKSMKFEEDTARIMQSKPAPRAGGKRPCECIPIPLRWRRPVEASFAASEREFSVGRRLPLGARAMV